MVTPVAFAPYGVVTDYVKGQFPKDATKLVSVVGEIADLAGKVLPGGVQAACQASGLANKVLSVAEVPGKGCDLAGEAVENGLTRKTFVKTCEVGGGVCGAIDLAVKFGVFTLSALAKSIFKGIGSAFLGLGTGCKALETAVEITADVKALDGAKTSSARDLASARLTQHLIEEAKWVSLFVLGVLGLVTVIVPALAVPWLTVALTVASVVAGIIGYFHEKMVVNPLLSQAAKQQAAPQSPAPKPPAPPACAYPSYGPVAYTPFSQPFFYHVAPGMGAPYGFFWPTC